MLDLMTQHAWIVFIRNPRPAACEAGAGALAPMWFARASETPPAISAKVNGEPLKAVSPRSREKDKGGAVGRVSERHKMKKDYHKEKGPQKKTHSSFLLVAVHHLCESGCLWLLTSQHTKSGAIQQSHIYRDFADQSKAYLPDGLTKTRTSFSFF